MTDKYEDIPKYQKKKESSTSKSDSKSKHKHDYSKECLLISDNHPHHAIYCNVCGKIKNIAFWETERTNEGYYRTLNNDEVYEKYKDLEKIYVDDIWQKYVPISEGGKK